jgi:hypothetical protein
MVPLGLLLHDAYLSKTSQRQTNVADAAVGRQTVLSMEGTTGNWRFLRGFVKGEYVCIDNFSCSHPRIPFKPLHVK